METGKKKIIFDTDIGGDCDDAGALALLHRLCDKGEAELLAVTHCFGTPYAAGCIDAINTYYGRVVPVGINYAVPKDDPRVYEGALSREFPNRYPPEVFGTDRAAPDTLTVLRETLAQAEDGSVTLVATGKMGSLARLVQSGPDDISPLTGKELILQKIDRTVVMGGRFYGTWPMKIVLEDGHEVTWEWNIYYGGVEDSQIVVNEWPGDLVFASYELGLWCVTMKEYAAKARRDDPVRRAYELHPCRERGRESWDHTAILEAVRPGEYWYLHPWGRVTVDDGGITHWHEEEGGRQTYLIPRVDYEVVRKTIDDLVLPPEER